MIWDSHFLFGLFTPGQSELHYFWVVREQLLYLFGGLQLLLELLHFLVKLLLPPVSDLVFLDVVECHALVALIALDFAIGAVPFVSENALSESDCSEIASHGMIFAGDVEIQQLKKHRLSSVGAK